MMSSIYRFSLPEGQSETPGERTLVFGEDRHIVRGVINTKFGGASTPTL